MPKTRPFSIYLLKEEFDHSNALKEEHDLEEADASELPEGARLYILDTERRPPWWRSYFGITKELYQQTKGALVFVPSGDRVFAISFGHVFHHLNDYSFEYDFGLRVTLNSLDPKELKSADMLSPGTARRKRTQVAISTDLTYLDFDGNSEIIKSLTGKVRDNLKELFKSATGSSSLKVSMKIDPTDLPDICNTLLDLYNKETYKDAFPNIQNISPIKDPKYIDDLDAKLLTAFKSQDEGLTLAIPDIVDYRDTKTCCIFRASGHISEIFPDITIGEFYSFLGDHYDLASATIEALKSFQMTLCDVDGSPGRSYSVMRSLVFEFEDSEKGVIYHLSDGNWYRAEKSFVTRLNSFIDQRCEQSELPPYDHDVTKAGKHVYSEEAYNASIPIWNNGYICLDQTNISPSGSTQIEPCDVYYVMDAGTVNSRAVFYHIKISTRSSQLSHLFNQGVNAVEFVELEQECKDNLKELIRVRLNGNDEVSYLAPLDANDFKIIFSVITHKDIDNGASNLPLFSRLSLMRAMQRLELYKIDCSLTYIDDQSPKKVGHAKYHQVVVEIVDEDGLTSVHAVADQEGFDPNVVITHCPKDVRDAAPGTRFRLQVTVNDDGKIRSHHTWGFELL
jgi:uncharacterized protein (TIGR04141 family)